MSANHENALTTVVSYPDRGTGGNNQYRGNCSPKLIADLIAHFQPHEICDYMCGSNTTRDAAAGMGIVSHTYDLHSGFDLLNCDIPERPQFIFWHPPYWDIIKYSDVMYRAADVQRRYGYDPRQSDLSRISTWDAFVKAMNYCMMKQFCALEKGGRMAVLVGDAVLPGSSIPRRWRSPRMEAIPSPCSAPGKPCWTETGRRSPPSRRWAITCRSPKA